jgi:hypothetical protein
MASFAAVDKDVAESKAEENAQVANIDVSTVSYMFDIANKIPESKGIQKCIVERHESFHISSLRPHAVFSIRFGSLDDNGAETSRLWAQRHVLAQEGEKRSDPIVI